MDALQQRVAQLETALATSRSTLAQSSCNISHSANGSAQESGNASPPDGIEQSLEDINLGVSLGHANHQVDTFPDQWQPGSDEKLLLLPPSRESSWQIANVSLSTVGWLHAAIRFDSFRQEHDRFWCAIGRGDHSVLRQHRWIAIYLAILAASPPALSLLGALKLLTHNVGWSLVW